jgi:thiamine phosphate synthase YjbQ (UPF0047 family)
MKSHTAYLTMNVPARMDFVNITGEVEKAVKQSGVRSTSVRGSRCSTPSSTGGDRSACW